MNTIMANMLIIIQVLINILIQLLKRIKISESLNMSPRLLKDCFRRMCQGETLRGIQRIKISMKDM